MEGGDVPVSRSEVRCSRDDPHSPGGCNGVQEEFGR